MRGQVPVGGAVVCGPDNRIVSAVSKLYPGRASVSPVMDVFVTLLAIVRAPAHKPQVSPPRQRLCVSAQGVVGWTGLLRQRKEVFPHLAAKLREFAAATGERVLLSRDNPVRTPPPPPCIPLRP